MKKDAPRGGGPAIRQSAPDSTTLLWDCSPTSTPPRATRRPLLKQLARCGVELRKRPVRGRTRTLLELAPHGANAEPDGDGVLHLDRTAQQRQRRDAEVGLV